MQALAALLGIPALVIFFWRRDMRKEMVWTGIFAVPIVLLPILIVKPFRPELLYSQLTLLKVLVGFLIAALAAALYKVSFRPYITVYTHPHRKHLMWLLIGPLLTLIVTWALGIALPFSLAAGLMLDLALVLVWRRDLMWDVLYSGFGMGLLYALIFMFLGGAIPGSVHSLWFGNELSGLSIGSLPIEELISIVLLGALAGPLYLVAKDEQEQLNPILTYRPWHVRPKRMAVLVFMAVLLAGGGWVSTMLVFQPNVVEAQASLQNNRLSLGNPIRISLDKPIQRTTLAMSISPDIEGSWSFEDPIWSREFFRTIVFTPRGYFTPDTSYSIRISGIRNVFGISETDYTYNFHTQSVPSVAKASIAHEQASVSVCDTITVTLDQPNHKLAVFEPMLDPFVPITATYNEADNSYLLKPESCLNQDTVYRLIMNRSLTIYDPGSGRLIRQTNPEPNFDLHFRTKAAPGLKGIEPQGTMLLPSQTKTIAVLFQEPMANQDVNGKIEITPAVSGGWAWETQSRLVYRLGEDLKLNTTYKVLVRPGIKDATGGSIEKEVSYSFSTIGPVKISKAYPSNGAGGIAANTAISITFDQEVDHASAEQAFSIEPAVQGSFGWSGKTMKFSSTFEKDTRYSYSVKSGIPSAIGGQDSAVSIRNTFQTEESTTLLNIPVYYQRHTLSCEVASLKMALGYRGVQVSEETLMDHVGYDPTPHEGNVWGDPDVAFVGSLDGRQNTTGYGVNWGPIAKAASAYRKSASFSGWSVETLAEQIAKGNPVVIWGIYPGGKYDPWTTPSGKLVAAWKGEHVRTLVGFTGKASSPTSFIINDPISGRLNWSTQQFKNNWATFGNSGVVIY